MTEDCSFKCVACHDVRRLPTPHLGCPVQCACGVVYTASVSVEALHRENRRLVSSVARLEKVIDAMTKAGAA